MNKELPKVGWYSYVVLLLAIVMFSGALTGIKGPWQALDFSTLNGIFGTISGAKGNFVGSGGSGARGGFLFSLSLAPAVILALGIVRIVDGYGGLMAAQKLISPLFKPLLGIPGICGLAFITSLQSTDGAAGMTKELHDSGVISDKERSLFCMLQLSGDGTITNYFSSIAGLFALFKAPVILPLIVIFICKIIGTNLMRLLLVREKSKA